MLLINISPDGIKTLLGKHVKPLLKCAVKLESKGDKTENRILVSNDQLVGFIAGFPYC